MLQNINATWPSTSSLEPAFTRIKSFLGEALRVIQLFPQKAQDLRVAYVSLVVINFVAWELGQMAAKLSEWILHSPNAVTESRSEDFRSGLYLMIGGCTIILTLKAFHDFAKLPISLDKFLAISVGVLAFRIFIESRRTSTQTINN